MAHADISLCVAHLINSAWIHETASKKNKAKEIKTSQLQENKDL